MAKFSRFLDHIPLSDADKIIKTAKPVETPEGIIFVVKPEVKPVG